MASSLSFSRVMLWSSLASVGVMACLLCCATAAAETMSKAGQASANPYREFNEWVHTFIFPDAFVEGVYDKLGSNAGYYMVMYIRDFVAGSLLYYITGLAWHVCIYKLRRETCFKPDAEMPTAEIIIDQIKLAQCSMTIYAGLPVLAEWLIEEGWTKVYYRIGDIGGWGMYALWTAVYISFVEIGIYWMHRTLHTNKFLYKYVHALHHKYKKPAELTPWCSVSFNPLDGILQACPYVICLFFVPCHYFTHIFLVFMTAVWATNIHDALDGDSEPIMGSKYHTMHHTHYHVNFGQWFVFCDWYWGTLQDPKKRAVKKEA